MTGKLTIRRRLVADRRGVAAAEMALLMPILCLFLCGVFQYGVLLYTYNSMLNTARNGARQVADGSVTAAALPDQAKTALPKWIDDTKWTIAAVTAASGEITTTISIAAADVTPIRFVPMPERLGVDIVMLKEGS